MNTPVSTAQKLRRQLLALAVPVLAAPVAWGQFAQTGVGPYDYNNTANWTDGNINGVWAAALDIGATQTVTFAADSILSTGFDIGYAGGGNLTFTGTGAARTVTLGGDILVNTATTRTVTFGSSTANQNLNVNLGGQTRNFTVAASRTLGFVNVISNGGLNLTGGTINFSGANTYSGATVINSGAVGFNGSSGSAANSDVTVKANGSATTTLTFGSGATGSGITRAKSVTLDGANSANVNTAILSLSGNSSTNNTVETISGALTVANGYGIVNISPNSNRNTRLVADSFVRDDYGVAYFRGTNLGANTIASQTANSSNIVFTNAPALTGGGGAAGTTTVSILKGAYGDTSTSGTGSGLVTYDSTYGVRLLGASEYTGAITDGQTQLDNVRIFGDGAGKTVTLDAATTTVNSLSVHQGTITAGSDAVIINGTGTLKVSSGVIYNITTNNGASADAVTIGTAGLDFNGQEALILTTGSNASGPGSFTINSQIVNASSLVKSGNGVLKIGGTTANTYTGDTIANGGTLELGKTAGVNAIGGNLIVNAGSVTLTNANQIADNKDVTVNGGTLHFAAPSVNGRDETIRNLHVTGGIVNTGTTTGSTITTVNATDATLAGGALNVVRKSSLVLSGSLSLSGGATAVVDRYNGTNTAQKTALSVGTGGLSITQAASGAYTPITLAGGNGAGIRGGELILNGDLTFIGNGSNANTATIGTIAASGGGGEGLVLLNGTRTFDIGNGAANVDLSIQAAITDGTSTGGLVKTGAGTLQLSGTNTYTGATRIDAGTLLLGASNRIADASNLILAGGTFATGGFSETLGALTLNGNATIDFGSGASALVFGDSSAAAWTGSVSLSLVNFTEGVDSIRFGTTAFGLTETQLGQIRINGLAATIGADGFLSVSAIPEPSAFAAFAGAAGLFAAGLRRRRRAAA